MKRRLILGYRLQILRVHGSTKISRDIEDFWSSIIDIDSFTLICQNVHEQGGIYPANNFRQIVQLDINEIGLRVAIVSSKITL